MNGRDELIFCVKLQMFFASCDGTIDESENQIIEAFINSYGNDKDVIDEELKNILEELKTRRIGFDEIIEDTKKALEGLDKKAKANAIKKYKLLIKTIISADGKIDDTEYSFFEKWKSGISGKSKKKINFGLVFLIILILASFGIAGVSGIKFYKDKQHKEMLKNFPLSAYTQKSFQFKEIDFSKVIIFGTDSDDPEKDSMLLYFNKRNGNTAFYRLGKSPDRL